jgi:hypothetical protein
MVKTSLSKSVNIRWRSTIGFVKKVYGIVVLCVVVIELFKFEELQQFIVHYLPSEPIVAYCIVSVVTVAGVLALPALMGMRMTRTLYAISVGANIIIVLEWLSLPVWFIK